MAVVLIADGWILPSGCKILFYLASAKKREVQKLLVNIDPFTGTACVPKVTYGRYDGATSIQFAAEGAGSQDVVGYVFSCTGYISLSLDQQGGEPMMEQTN